MYGETKYRRIRVVLNFDKTSFWHDIKGVARNSLSVSNVTLDAACPSLSVITSTACILVLLQWVWLKFLFNPIQIGKVTSTVQRDYANILHSTDKDLQKSWVVRKFGIYVKLPQNCSLQNRIMCDLLSVTLARFYERTLTWLLCCGKIAHIKHWVMIFVEMEVEDQSQLSKSIMI